MKQILFLFFILLVPYALAGQTNALFGFSSTAAAKEQDLENKFDQQLQAKNLDQWMKQLAMLPHHVGSAHGKANAEFIAAQFKSWGWETNIEEFQVLFPTPKLRVLEVVSPTPYKAKLTEKALKEDPSTSTPDMLPSFNCFSVDGDVTAEVVFVNYGLPADYDLLERYGIDVKGKIVISRYGGSWRGIKPKVAAEHGAIGCLIYSDPKDDGYGAGEVYPKGAFKNETGVQRGSVLDMPLAPGDPLTPGYGATKDAKRIDRKDAATLTKIPVLPISYEDAQPIFAAMGGPVAPAEWRGGLPLTYHLGPGPTKVHLKLEFNWELRPAYDVIAKLKGSEFPDQWVIRGNHHDAWVHGANDPISGLIAEMEEARVIGMMAKNGQGPKRTLIYCAWDAEEPGLLGSTEWVEAHADELKQKAVAYINSDSNGAGFLGAGGSNTLEKFFNQVARDVTDPQTQKSVLDRRNAANQVFYKQNSTDFKLEALGSGSDFTPFIQHLGIASLNIGFGGEDDGGEYHTIYDTYADYVRFKDNNFMYGIALAKVGGRTALRLANAEILPFDFQHFYETVRGYSDEVIRFADEQREKTEKENRLISEGVYGMVLNPRESIKAPKVLAETPHFNFAPILTALDKLEKAANHYQEMGDKTAANAAMINQVLMHLEQKLTLEQGLPKRPWFKHFIYAPGFYTGYGVKTLPGIREAIEQREFLEVDKQIANTAQVLNAFTAEVEKLGKLK
jgi:N-acetylated-alpha-linked acidic dipeptidase